MKGLKQMVAAANAALAATEEKPEPVQVSGDAMAALSRNIRVWSGWPDARLVAGDPRDDGGKSPWARTHVPTHTFTFNPDTLVLNPNRVLFTVTPFRLRQEAVLTGALLHEAGHARHSKWIPSTKEQADVKPLVHKDGTTPTPQCVALALLMEEPRIEGLMARDEKQVGAATLGWTMRASAAELMPVTTLSHDPNQQIMDLISSWALRAGRQYALEGWLPNYALRSWVQDFTSLLNASIKAHLMERVDNGALDCDPVVHTQKILTTLVGMTTCDDDTGSSMIDMARLVLDWLFPETPGETEDDQPMPSSGCESDPEESEPEGEGEPEQGEPEQGEPEQGEGEPEDDPQSGEDGAQGDEPEAGEGQGQSEDEGGTGEPQSSGATPSTEGEAESEAESELAKALAAMEAAAKDASEDEADAAAETAEEEAASGKGAGSGGTDHVGGGWRMPSKEERVIQSGAEKFLRDLIDASETSKTSLSETPSATVDGSALAAWKAGGQHGDPHFFIRTRREVQPSPPVKIAVLVDVSSSMDDLAKPSAVLSWALSAAALDLRNFAGRGQQVESCLIHWGWKARVIQGTGEVLPGIREHGCSEGTAAMASALELVEEQMPGFFDITPTPVNRLLVQFTDWELFGPARAGERIKQAMAAGVNMLTVAPRDYSPRSSDLDAIMRSCAVKRGTSTLIKYDPQAPANVWASAAEALL